MIGCINKQTVYFHRNWNVFSESSLSVGSYKQTVLKLFSVWPVWYYCYIAKLNFWFLINLQMGSIPNSCSKLDSCQFRPFRANWNSYMAHLHWNLLSWSQHQNRSDLVQLNWKKEKFLNSPSVIQRLQPSSIHLTLNRLLAQGFKSLWPRWILIFLTEKPNNIAQQSSRTALFSCPQ